MRAWRAITFDYQVRDFMTTMKQLYPCCHTVAKAEIARELGNFDECLGLLSHPFDERYGHAVGFIKKLAEEKVLVVRSISPAK